MALTGHGSQLECQTPESKIERLEKRVEQQETLIAELRRQVETLMHNYRRNLPMR